MGGLFGSEQTEEKKNNDMWRDLKEKASSIFKPINKPKVNLLMWIFTEHTDPHLNLLCQISASKWFLNIYYQFYCPCQEDVVLKSSTQGNTRPLGPRLFGSHLAPHTPLPHTPQSPCHTHRSDTALGSISDCGCRSFRFLCRYLHETEQQHQYCE